MNSSRGESFDRWAVCVIEYAVLVDYVVVLRCCCFGPAEMILGRVEIAA